MNTKRTNNADEQNAGKKERQKKEKIIDEYICYGFCRLCPFPGAKCCKNSKAAK